MPMRLEGAAHVGRRSSGSANSIMVKPAVELEAQG